MIDKLVLIDGLACVYRAFYAIRNLNAEDGSPVNAVYGFILQLESVIREIRPTHLGVCFDGGLSESRTSLHDGYKAQRPEMPEDLKKQLPLINEFLDAVSIYWFLGEGIEADDAIASMVRQFRENCAELYIVSSDKDLFQLVDRNVSVFLPGKDRKVMDPDAVREKTGVRPDQIIDWLAMVGDASDNIPGVPGVGAKTAAALLDEFGSLPAILGNLENIKREKIREALQSSREILKRNVELVTLKDVDCAVDEQELLYSPVLGSDLQEFLKKLDFGSMLDRLMKDHFMR